MTRGGDVRRVVVVAAHPDDESLGAGGLVHRAHALGVEVVVVVATDGEASHPHSPTRTPADLARVRREELREAVHRLAPRARVHHLGLPDGALGEHRDALTAALVETVGDGRGCLLVAPWRRDGHADHEAAGTAAATAAARTEADLWEYPVWFWHWGRPDQAPWDDLRVLDLDPDERLAKAAAQAAHRSQVEPLSDQPGDEALLGPGLLSHFAGPREVYVLQPPHDGALEDLHASEADPWLADSSEYERRKRDLLLAALPRASFRRGLEVGSSTGALAADLATRCAELLVVDASAHAVAAARARCADLPGVRVEQRRLPEEWPTEDAADGGFDLVVLSEVGYFLSPAALERLVEELRSDLAADGVVVLCHWRHPVRGWPLDGADVHRIVVAADLRPVIATYRDADVELLVLGAPDLLPTPGSDRG
nr:bifunctional PIG-L family deacetylase/class I SAM-dependent methyltransferase [Nocardioides flavescens]